MSQIACDVWRAERSRSLRYTTSSSRGMHGPDGACFHRSTHEQCSPTDATRHLRNPMRNPNAKQRGTAAAPTEQTRGSRTENTYARTSSSGSGSPAATPAAAATASSTSASARIPGARRPRPIPCAPRPITSSSTRISAPRAKAAP